MATDNNINKYTAADIERYHKGQLSPGEMHQLEKAALDDPFLADALEGFTTPGVNLANDMTELRKRLAARTEEKKVIPIAAAGGRKVPFLRIAAMIAILAVAAYLVTQMTLNKKNDEIVSTEPVKGNDLLRPDSGKVTPVETVRNSADKNAATPVTERSAGQRTVTSPTGPATGKEGKTDAAGIIDTGKEISKTETIPVPVELKEKNTDDEMLSRKDKPVETPASAAAKISERDKDEKKAKQVTTGGRDIATRKADNNADRYQAMNTFRGRVMDGSNIGVPFANVTNIQDNAGTYADANGYFNFRSPDTALNVQVRSIGFENRVTQLRATVPTNEVVLQDDRSMNEMVISNQRPNAESRANRSTRTVEEPEPADGWSNYDAYLANNLHVPDDYENKPVTNPTVEVSFEVDMQGEPVNIKVERSLCSKCDKEAIRLIKEGPKWKQNANRRGRTTVTINF